MPTVTATRENLAELLGANDTVLLDFWAGWCAPCKMFAPVFEAAATRHPDLTFAKVDTEVEVDLASAFGIMSIPTLAVVRDRVVVFSQPGALPEPALEQVIAQVRELDMEEVRQQLELADQPQPTQR